MKSLVSYLSNNRIKWQFTTALAPWEGGFYVRLVGLVKAKSQERIWTEKAYLRSVRGNIG